MASWKARGRLPICANCTFFGQLSRLRCYEQILVEIVLFERGWVTLSTNLRGSSTNEFWRQKTRVPGLSCGVVCVILRLAILIQYRRVTQTHRQTRDDGYYPRIISTARVFNGWTRQEGRAALPNFVQIAPIEAEIRWFFKMAAAAMAAAAILDFWNFEFLTVGRVTSVELCHHAKFRGDRLNRCRDIAIFGFSKMAAIRHLGFVMSVFRPPTNSTWWSLSV